MTKRNRFRIHRRCRHDLKSLLEDFNRSPYLVYSMHEMIGDYKTFKSAAESMRNSIKKYGYKNMRVTQNADLYTIYIIKVK